MSLGPVDCCPACLTAASPYRAEIDPGGMRAFYQCRNGHRWHTGWALTPEEMTAYEAAAA